MMIVSKMKMLMIIIIIMIMMVIIIAVARFPRSAFIGIRAPQSCC